MKLTSKQINTITICAVGVVLLAWLWCVCNKEKKETYSSCTTRTVAAPSKARAQPYILGDSGEKIYKDARVNALFNGGESEDVTDLGNPNINVSVIKPAIHELAVVGWQTGRLNPDELTHPQRWTGVM